MLPVIAAVVLQVTLPIKVPDVQTHTPFAIFSIPLESSFDHCLKIRDIIKNEYKAKGVRASVTCKKVVQ